MLMGILYLFLGISFAVSFMGIYRFIKYIYIFSHRKFVAEDFKSVFNRDEKTAQLSAEFSNKHFGILLSSTFVFSILPIINLIYILAMTCLYFFIVVLSFSFEKEIEKIEKRR